MVDLLEIIYKTATVPIDDHLSPFDPALADWRASRIAAQKMLGWLKEQERSNNEEPLTLNSTAEWGLAMKALFLSELMLHNYFIMSADKIEFRDDLPVTQKRAITRWADEHYQPVLKRYGPEKGTGDGKRDSP